MNFLEMTTVGLIAIASWETGRLISGKIKAKFRLRRAIAKTPECTPEAPHLPEPMKTDRVTPDRPPVVYFCYVDKAAPERDFAVVNEIEEMIEDINEGWR